MSVWLELPGTVPPALIRTRMNGPFASKLVVSPARPGRKSTASTYTGRGGKPFEALKFGSFNVRRDHGRMLFCTQLEAGRTPLRMNGIVSAVRLASAGIVVDRSAVRSCCCCVWTSGRSARRDGRLASTAGPVLTTPGISARAKRRSGGKAAFSEFKAGGAGARARRHHAHV